MSKSKKKNRKRNFNVNKLNLSLKTIKNNKKIKEQALIKCAQEAEKDKFLKKT